MRASPLGQAVEVGVGVGKEGGLGGLGLFGLLPARAAQQVVDQGLGVDLLLNEQGRGVDDKVRPVLLILAAPDKLGVEVAIARGLLVRERIAVHAALVRNADGLLCLLVEDGLELCGGDIGALRLIVGECGDFFGGGFLLRLFGHGRGFPSTDTINR